MAEKTLDTLFYEQLKDVYYAEKKILKALPKMARAANDEKLKAAFEEHREQTQTHVDRLGEVFEIVGKRARSKTCEAIDGIVEEGEEVIEDFNGNPALDAGLIASAQAVEHYEIARYGTLKAWAEQLGHPDAAKLLQQTLDEEEATDSKLSKLAKSAVNAAATRPAAA